MPKGKLKLFKVNLRRKGSKPKTVHTQAISGAQAKRFVKFRNRGFRITRVTEE